MDQSYPNPIPLFPLTGVILLPGSILPLHIFEPRYRQMLEDALAAEAYIGMIQPCQQGGTELYEMGCLGEIETHRQLPNGNYLIRLQGVTRFRVEQETTTEDILYRTAQVNYQTYAHDTESAVQDFDSDLLYNAFQDYVEKRHMQIDWDKIRMIPIHHLINILSMNLEFTSMEKQTLLESHDLHQRLQDLVTLLQMASDADGSFTSSDQLVN